MRSLAAVVLLASEVCGAAQPLTCDGADASCVQAGADSASTMLATHAIQHREKFTVAEAASSAQEGSRNDADDALDGPDNTAPVYDVTQCKTRINLTDFPIIAPSKPGIVQHGEWCGKKKVGGSGGDTDAWRSEAECGCAFLKWYSDGKHYQCAWDSAKGKCIMGREMASVTEQLNSEGWAKQTCGTPGVNHVDAITRLYHFNRTVCKPGTKSSTNPEGGWTYIWQQCIAMRNNWPTSCDGMCKASGMFCTGAWQPQHHHCTVECPDYDAASGEPSATLGREAVCGGYSSMTCAERPKGTAAQPICRCSLTGTTPDPVDCVMNDWGDWSGCDAPCGSTGTRTRTRTVKTEADAGGRACGVTLEDGECPWRDCTATCAAVKSGGWIRQDCESTSSSCDALTWLHWGPHFNANSFNTSLCKQGYISAADPDRGWTRIWNHCRNLRTNWATTCDGLCNLSGMYCTAAFTPTSTHWGGPKHCNAYDSNTGLYQGYKSIQCSDRPEHAAAICRCDHMSPLPSGGYPPAEDCEMGEWGEWGSCLAGQKKRTRAIEKEGCCTGAPCTSTEEINDC